MNESSKRLLEEMLLKTLKTLNEPPRTKQRREVEQTIEEKINRKLSSNDDHNRTTTSTSTTTRSYNLNPRSLPAYRTFRPHNSPLRSTCFRTTTEPSITFLPGKNDGYVKKLLSRCKPCRSLDDDASPPPLPPKLINRRFLKRDIVTNKRKLNSKTHHHHHHHLHHHKVPNYKTKSHRESHRNYELYRRESSHTHTTTKTTSKIQEKPLPYPSEPIQNNNTVILESMREK